MGNDLNDPLWRTPADRAEWIATGLSAGLVLLVVTATVIVAIIS